MAFGLQRVLHQRQAAWLTLVVGLLLTAGLGWQMHREAVEMDRQRLAVRVAEVTAQLDARLEKSEMLLHNLRDYLTFSGENREQVFARWCYENGLSINCPWLHGIMVATNASRTHWWEKTGKPSEAWTATQWEAFSKFARSQMVDCQIALRSEVKDGKRFGSRYGFQQAYAGSDPLARVIQGSRVGMSQRTTVMLDANSNYIVGTYYFAPVFEPEVADLLAIPSLNRDQSTYIRWMHLTSLIVAPVDFKELARSVWDGMPADLGMELFASKEQIAGTWLDGPAGTPHAADLNFNAYLTHRQDWPMYGAMFSIFYYTTPLFEAQSPRRLAQIAMAAGAALTLLASALVSVALRARNRQELMTEQIREARDALAAAQQERNRISRDLHDGTIQSLYAIQLGLGHTIKKLEADPGKAGRELSAMREELDTVIAEIRQFITAETEGDKPVDFSAVLDALVQRARAGTTAQMALRCEPGVADRLTAAQAVQLANIAREALSNSLRHGKPQAVTITLRAERENVVLEISDDGAGFDSKSPNGSGIGLASMLSRTQEAGGKLEVQSSPGKGTRIVVRVPAFSCEPIAEDESSPEHKL